MTQAVHQVALAQRVAALGSKAIDDFSRSCLEGARRVLADRDNPLRLNLFSAAMRILFDHMMDALAPKDAVARAAWFKSEPEMAGNPTRGQRIVFAIQGGLTEDFVAQQLHIDPAPLRKRLLHAVDECSKQVHARENTIVVDQNEQDAMATATISAVESLLDAVRDCRAALLEPIADSLDEAAVMTLLTETLDSVDELATHWSLQDVCVHETKVHAIGAETITYRSKGKIYVILQYGSNSDLRNDMGAEIPESFPFTCDIEVGLEDPWSLEWAETHPCVDTSKWRDAMMPDELR